MRVGAAPPPAASIGMGLVRHAVVQTASQASQPTIKPVRPADPLEAAPAPRPVSRNVIDIRV